MMDERMISTTEAAHILGVDRATVTRWVHAGKVRPAFRLNSGALIFDRAHITEYAAQIMGEQQ